MDRYDDFEERYNKYKDMENEKSRQASKLSNLRLTIFLLGAAVCVFAFIKAGFFIGMPAVLLSLTAFVYLVIRYGKVSRELARLKCKAEINHMYMERLRTGWTGFSDSGSEFEDLSHPYLQDLDIFGSKSLFQWISTANTHYGRHALRDLLAAPDKSTGSIISRQKAVKELAWKLDFCQELQSDGMLAKGVSDDPEKLLEYAETQSGRSSGKVMTNIIYIMPFLVILSFILFLLGGPVPLFIPALLLTLQMVVFAAGYKRNAEIINSVYGMRKHLGAYTELLARIEKETFKDGHLNELKGQLFSDGIPSSDRLEKLESIANAVDLKYSTVLYFLLNILLLWDYHCAIAIEEWKRQHGINIRKWLEIVGKMEALSSLAVIGHMHSEWTYPTLREGVLKFDSKKIGHPLIREGECVRNDFVLSGGACVITGSNMSGKTTLLRTVGINLVLAYAGAPVFADRLECGIMDVFTSMRVHDDLNSGISTFYAELLRIKMIIDYSLKELPMIFLIDEIFMGTNSRDRITGARSVLRNLSKKWIIGLISTHDFELCDLEQESQVAIKNYHFTENYINNTINFDYKLRPGRSRTTNAKYLMKMVGIDLKE